MLVWAEIKFPLFSYASRLTETILLGVIAEISKQDLHWDSQKAAFKESEANQFLNGKTANFNLE